MSLNEFLRDREKMNISTEPIFSSQWFEFFKYQDKPPPQLLAYLSFVNQIIVSKFSNN